MSDDRFRRPPLGLWLRWRAYGLLERYAAWVGRRAQRMRDGLMANSFGYERDRPR